MATVAVLDTTYPDLRIEEEVLDGQGIDLHREDRSTPEAILSCGHADVIIVGSRARFDANIIGRLTIRGIVRAGVGVESVDVEAAAASGIVVCNVPDYGTETVAQHALAMALAGSRRLVEADEMVRRGQWGFQSIRPMHLPSASVAGVLGLGRIGSRTAKLFGAVGFGTVLGHDPFVPVPPAGVESVGFEELLERCDVLSVHIPGRADASPIIGAAELQRMRPGSVIVNTARGSVIDAEALAEALATGRPRIAALDVFTVEPPDLSVFAGVDSRLVLSPHQAWYTEESQADLRRKSAEEALRILNGEPPRNPVVPQPADPAPQEQP